MILCRRCADLNWSWIVIALSFPPNRSHSQTLPHQAMKSDSSWSSSTKNTPFRTKPTRLIFLTLPNILIRVELIANVYKSQISSEVRMSPSLFLENFWDNLRCCPFRLPFEMHLVAVSSHVPNGGVPSHVLTGGFQRSKLCGLWHGYPNP